MTESLVIDAAVDEEQSCLACQHPLADHSAIDLRYCRATQLHVLTRACICRPPRR